MATPPPTVWLLPSAPAPGRFDAPRRHVAPVDRPESAAAALAAAAMGDDLVVHVSLSGSTRQRFLEDLTRLGATIIDGRPPDPQPTAEQAALLDLLAGGATVTAAAAALHVSRRTTNRMLQEARDVLGVASNAEAVRAWAARDRP